MVYFTCISISSLVGRRVSIDIDMDIDIVYCREGDQTRPDQTRPDQTRPAPEVCVRLTTFVVIKLPEDGILVPKHIVGT